MSETRALREKLEELQAELRRAREHLEKLRAHQAREREPLVQELEAARREVAGLRERLHQAESRASAPPAAGSVPFAPENDDRPDGATTALVALARTPSLMGDALAALSKVLKLAPVDVRMRLAPKPPTVVARLPLTQAAELRAALREEGFLAVACPVVPRAELSWLRVRHFELEEQGLTVEGVLGERLQVRYAQLRLMMRGRQSSTQVELQQDVDTAQPTAELKQEVTENYLWVLGKGTRLAFTQSTHFNALGDQRAPSVFENLLRLARELQRRAPHVVLDERFVQMPRFLMPLVDEDRSQELLAELLLQAVEEGLWS